MSDFQITRVHHIQLAIPLGSEDAARAFYGQVLGLSEVAKPVALQGRGGVWFQDGLLALHLGVQDPFVPAQKAHPAFAVTDLDAAHIALGAHGATGISTLPGLRRFYIADPFGNRIEIVQPDDAPFAD